MLFVKSITAGICLALPFISTVSSWLVLVVVLPFLYLIYDLEKQKVSTRWFVFFVWLAGLIMMLIVLFWVTQLDTVFLAGLQSGWVTFGLFFTYFGFAGILSLGFVLFGYLYRALNLRLLSPQAFLFVPALWVVCEFLRSWLYSLAMYGSNGSIGANWNFGDLGFPASSTVLVYSSRLVGLYGLGVIVILVNLALFWLLHQRWKFSSMVLLAVMLLVGLGYAGYATPRGSELKVGALQVASAATDETSRVLAEAQESKTQPLGLDVLVLPEYVSIFEKSKQADSVTLGRLMSSPQSPIITSKKRTENGKNHNTLIAYNSSAQPLYQHDKILLIPVGEAMPYSYEYIYKMLGQTQMLEMIRGSREIHKGQTEAMPFRASGHLIAATACSGAVYPEQFRSQVQSGAELLTNSASLVMFANAPTYHAQAQQIARFITVSNARPFVQSAKAGSSAVVDHNGRLLASTTQTNPGLITAGIMTNRTKTVYSQLGEWVLGVSAVVIVAKIGWNYRQKLMKRAVRTKNQ